MDEPLEGSYIRLELIAAVIGDADGLEAVGEVASSTGDPQDSGMWVGLKIEGRSISVG